MVGRPSSLARSGVAGGTPRGRRGRDRGVIRGARDRRGYRQDFAGSWKRGGPWAQQGGRPGADIVGISSGTALNKRERQRPSSTNAFVHAGSAPLKTSAPDLGSGTARCGGSSPSSCTHWPFGPVVRSEGPGHYASACGLVFVNKSQPSGLTAAADLRLRLRRRLRSARCRSRSRRLHRTSTVQSAAWRRFATARDAPSGSRLS
jgi:hypothetical protein